MTPKKEDEHGPAGGLIIVFMFIAILLGAYASVNSTAPVPPPTEDDSCINTLLLADHDLTDC